MMIASSFFVLFSFLALKTKRDNMTQPAGFFLKVRQDGEWKRYRLFVAASDWTKDVIVSEDEKSITLIGNQQVRLCNDDQSRYVTHALANTRVSWLVDLSAVKKSWNAALYTADFTNLVPPGYLDAQSSESRCEMDFQEANRLCYHYTAHNAGDKNGSLIMGLGGSVQTNPHQKFKCEHNTLSSEELYGVGKYIDTNLPFKCIVTHTSTAVRLELHQSDRVIYNETTDNYINSIFWRLHQPVHCFIMSLWTGFMDWLDGSIEFKDESHIPAVKATFSNIEIDRIAGTTDATPPAPTAPPQPPCTCG
jgi:hypothetical protein